MAVVTKEESTKLLLKVENGQTAGGKTAYACLLYTSPSPRDTR